MPHLTPHGLDEFVDKVVPELQERGVFRTDYTGTTLRDHLGLRSAARLGGSAGGGGALSPLAREELVRPHAVGVVVRDGGDEQLVGAGLVGEHLELVGHRRR